MAKWGEGDPSCTVKEVETCDGEAVVNNRKGKLIFFYEWNIALKWDSNDDSDISGKINIPNLSEENDISEVDIEITLKSSTNEGEKVKHFLHTKGKEKLRDRLALYISALKEEFSRGMILPQKNRVNKNVVNSVPASNIKAKMNEAVVSSNKSLGYKIATTTIKQQQKFQCRGNIYGEFEEVSPTKIVQKWRTKQWPDGHFSEVTIDINEKSDHTEVNLTQTEVPSTEEESTKENWDRYYWDAIKRTFGFGYFM
ncbi:hypothetical protein G9C98_007658 [Cotesia typhae]|uniref:Activator of Hsp90 ATPase AHSA1-like N-terminal domain-containing protein n=1 Tax=Cotesia typhae TaxID=2053667 RepID=A0A8J5QVR3_9HYME|nr:hypothetical protein G9C98_007658 [Cotesia typhae]